MFFVVVVVVFFAEFELVKMSEWSFSADHNFCEKKKAKNKKQKMVSFGGPPLSAIVPNHVSKCLMKKKKKN